MLSDRIRLPALISLAIDAMVSVGDAVKTQDCYFAETAAPTVAIALNALSGDEDLQWNGTIAGYELDGSDVVECHFSIV